MKYVTNNENGTQATQRSRANDATDTRGASGQPNKIKKLNKKNLLYSGRYRQYVVRRPHIGIEISEERLDPRQLIQVQRLRPLFG